MLPRTLLLLPVLTWACASETNDDQGGTDAGRDGGVDAGAGDSGAPGDSGAQSDAGPDDSLSGTTLEGIEVRWPAALELCTAWQEGRPIADELALKVHLTLGPEVRPSLGRQHLGSATLSTGRLRRGPLSTQQSAIPSATSSLVSYQLQDPSGSTFLQAELQHAISGGVVHEFFTVRRDPGDRRPVEVDERGEHHFEFIPDGRSEGTRLEPCGGLPHLRPAIFALSAGVGPQAFTLVRFARTDDLRTAQIVPERGLLQRTANAYDVIPFSGFWSETYAAGHHNWDESTVFDFSGDVGLYETVIEPARNGGAPIRADLITRIALHAINTPGGGNPTALVTTLDTATGQEQTATLAAGASWARVDSAYLAQTITACASGAVVSLISGGNSSTVQLLTCPTASLPGFQVVGLVPILFTHDPGLVGRRFEGAAITAVVVEGRSGYRIDLGPYDVLVTKNPAEEYYFFEVRDAADTSVESSLASPVDLHLPWRPTEVLRFASSNGAVQVELQRQWAAQGVGESSIYAPVSLTVDHDGARQRIDTWDNLDYTNTHHNWGDELIARTPEARYHFEVRFTDGLHYFISAHRSDNTVLLPETELTPAP